LLAQTSSSSPLKWLGKKCKTETSGSNSATICAIVNEDDFYPQNQQGLGRISRNYSGPTMTIYWVRLYNAANGSIIVANEVDKTDTDTFMDSWTPWETQNYNNKLDCYAQVRYVVYFPGGSWVLSTVNSYTQVDAC
jgi:hypothetical protein